MIDLTMRRRDFLKTLGGGILVLVSLPAAGAAELSAQGRGYPTDINAYLHIAQDGRVTLFSGKVELGQGVMTSLTQMAAEDLGVSVDAIHIVMGDTDSCPYDMGTFGSMTTRFFGPAVRAAAAQARLILTDLAARHLAVPRAALTVENGVVYVTADRSRRVTYGALAQGQRITHTVDERAILRSAREFAVMGRSLKRLDGPEKVTGAAKYAGDIRLPGMLYARIVRPPAHGARPTSLDTSAAAAMPGVTVVTLDGLVAVLANDPETAERALRLVRAAFDVPAPAMDTESVFDHLVAAAPQAQEQRGGAGDLDAGRSQSARTFDVTYRTPYLAHAPIEPHTALAEIKDGKATVWTSAQTPFPQRDAVATALGFRPQDVRVITPYVGGGFGGKSAGRQAVEAARLAQATRRPVQVAWTRAEEFFYDAFQPAAVMRINSGVDASGHLTLWDYQVYAAGSRGADVFYDVPNRRVRVYGSWGGGETPGGTGLHPFAVGPWRAPGANANRFAAEQQMDIMASAAGMDPLQFRLQNTSDPRMLSVLRAVADAYGWQPAAAPRRAVRGRGLACGVDAGTYVAHVAEVSVDRTTGAVRVERVVCAQEMGIVVNPDGARMQMEGCVTMGLGYALAEEVRFQGGRVMDANFDTYTLPRFSWVPAIETVLVPNDALAPQGGGEPAIINMGAVIANAVFDATGARILRLPLTRERVLAEMRKV